METATGERTKDFRTVRGDLSKTVEFAAIVIRSVFDQFAGADMKMNDGGSRPLRSVGGLGQSGPRSL
jgi:hypothetical protein